MRELVQCHYRRGRFLKSVSLAFLFGLGAVQAVRADFFERINTYPVYKTLSGRCRQGD